MSTLLAIVVVLLTVVVAVLGALLVRRSRRTRLAPSPRRILFPFVGQALSQSALDATLRLALAESATLVPAYLAEVPLNLPLECALPGESWAAMPLLEAIEHRAGTRGVPVDARIERGRTHRHALRELLEHERYDRIVVAAATNGTDGFSAADVAWLLDHAEGEILVLRPRNTRTLTAPRAEAGAVPEG